MDNKLHSALEIADRCQKELVAVGFHPFILATNGKPCATSFIKSTVNGDFDKSEMIEMLVKNIILRNENGTEQGTKEVLECLTNIIVNIQEIKKKCDESLGKE